MFQIEWSDSSIEEFDNIEPDPYSHLFSSVNDKLSPILETDNEDESEDEDFDDDYDTMDDMVCIVCD